MLGFCLCGLFSSCSAQASRSCGLSLWSRGSRALRLQYLPHADSGVAALGLWNTDTIGVVHGLNCSTAWGIFLDQGSNPCFLPWQKGSSPQSHQGSPVFAITLE